jgi:prepilin peptidase dependent protein B
MLISMRKKQSGASIVDILIGLVLSIIVIAAVLGVFSSTFNASNRVMQRGKLDRDLSAIMDIIVSDIQRAGYWYTATTNAMGSTNPFMTGTNNITVNASSNCVTFSYNNTNSTNDTNVAVGDTDQFGYGLSGNAIKFRQAGSTFNCSGVAGWSNLSDTNAVTITGFTVASTNTAVDIDDTNPGIDTINFRKVTVTITGNLTSATDNTNTVSRTINVYNNKYIP